MERMQVLRSKLRHDLLPEILKFDAHPLADMIKGLQFIRFPGGLSIKTDRGYFVIWSDWVKEDEKMSAA